MKLTDAMVLRAATVLAASKGRPNVTAGDDRTARRMLENALADIPGPEEVRDEIMSGLAYGRDAERNAAYQDALALHRVREWRRSTLTGSAVATPDWQALDRILAGEP